MPPTPRPAAAERRLRAMGSDAHLIVVGGRSGLADMAVRRIADLERRWSRFLPDSELSRLNACSGHAVAVSAETRVLVHCAVRGWQDSGGLFDPTVHDALHTAGYDRAFALLNRPDTTDGTVAATTTLRGTTPAPGCDGIVIDDEAGTVRLPGGVRVDPGGIGKGLATDLLVDELLVTGAKGVCVNLGGDLRVAGDAPDGAGWRIALPTPVGAARSLHLRDGAVATSSTRRRRWRHAGAIQHHLIDPATGAPAARPNVEATAIAATGWQAEVAAKTALLTPVNSTDDVLGGLAVAAAVTDADGRVHALGRLSTFLSDERVLA